MAAGKLARTPSLRQAAATGTSIRDQVNIAPKSSKKL
jgi:hypothetical protein